ncbi:MAG: hypothetical protein V4719_18245 [Planctomycetota bacterium]
MSDDEFKSDLRLIVDLEDEIDRVHDGMREQQWVKDRIDNLTYLYRHLEEVWWPIVPGRGTHIEGECCGDNQASD